ncbi:MAG: hpsN 2 [Firmicutes bacterium]|nr:hpsN 2 [Bacillota bacterium]
MREYLKEPKPSTAEDKQQVQQTVREVLAAIQEKGGAAVRSYSRQFDKWDPQSFRVSEAEIHAARKGCSAVFLDDLRFCQTQVREFAKRQMETLSGFEVETHPGVILGQKLIPIQNSGSYVPGGRYPLVASAHMSVITPKVAGVERVIACTPPTPEGQMYPNTLAAISEAGADEIYSLGGIQALGAMAFGTEEIKHVDFIAGPGNRFVAEAKKQLFGVVGIDLLAGPSEVLVIADDSADPRIVAADLLAQAEHGLDSPAWLVTTSRALAEAVIADVERQLATLATAAVAGVAWRDCGAVILVDSYEEAAAISDEYAPEHLEVQVRDLDFFFHRLRNYGSLFLGEHSTVAFSDKTIGTNHILPTGKAARYTGGLSVLKFMKSVTYQRLTAEGASLIAPICARQCRIEGMIGHAVSCEVRAEKYGKA